MFGYVQQNVQMVDIYCPCIKIKTQLSPTDCIHAFWRCTAVTLWIVRSFAWLTYAIALRVPSMVFM